VVRHIERLRRVYAEVQTRRPFEIVAVCVLPDHIHAPRQRRAATPTMFRAGSISAWGKAVIVMAGLVPAIHVLLYRQDVDARDMGERSDAVLRTAMRGHDGGNRQA
jgi:hypothetical protein